MIKSTRCIVALTGNGITSAMAGAGSGWGGGGGKGPGTFSPEKFRFCSLLDDISSNLSEPFKRSFSHVRNSWRPSYNNEKQNIVIPEKYFLFISFIFSLLPTKVHCTCLQAHILKVLKTPKRKVVCRLKYL